MARRIELTYAPNTDVADLMADVDVTVPADAEVNIADFVNLSVLDSCKSKAVFTSGKYNIRMLLVITREDNGTPESTD